MLNHLTPRIQSCSKTKVQNSRQQKSLRYNFIYTFPFLSPDIPQNVELIGEGGIGHRQKIRREGGGGIRCEAWWLERCASGEFAVALEGRIISG